MTKQEILSRITAARPTKAVTVADGAVFTVRTMTVGERASLGNLKGIDLTVGLLAMGLADENGGRLFNDAEKSNLKGLDAPTADALSEAIIRFNKLADEDIADEEKP